MKTVNEMVSLIKKYAGVSKDKEVEFVMGMKPMSLASLKRENRVGSFLRFLAPFCQKKGLLIDDFLIKDKNAELLVDDTYRKDFEQEKDDMLYREKFEAAQERIISLLEEMSQLQRENSELKTGKKERGDRKINEK